MAAAPASPSTSQLKTIVTLFVILRVTILLLYTPQGLLNAYTDFHHYYRTAQLSDQGYYPYVNSWSEYPPLLGYTTQAVYSAVRSLVPMGGLNDFSYQVFARLLGAIMLIFETGSLILLHRIATRTWDVERANWLGWVYSALSVPLFYWNASQTSNFVFFTLLAVYWFITNKRTASAVSLALGMLIKLTPVFLLGSVARFLWPAPKPIARYVLIVAVVFALAFVPFVLLGGGSWTMASLASNVRARFVVNTVGVDRRQLGRGRCGRHSSAHSVGSGLQSLRQSVGDPADAGDRRVRADLPVAVPPPDRSAQPSALHLVHHADAAAVSSVVQRLESAVGDVDHPLHPAVVPESTRTGAGVDLDAAALHRVAAVRCAEVAAAHRHRHHRAHGVVRRHERDALPQDLAAWRLPVAETPRSAEDYIP